MALEGLSKLLSHNGTVFEFSESNNDFNLIKSERDYDPKIREIINLITTRPGIKAVGSFKFKDDKFPGDIDVLEKYVVCCTINQTRLSLASKIQTLVKRITERPNIYLGDFKAGYDERYNVYIGEIQNGIIVDYDYILIKREIDNLYEQRLFSFKEYKYITSLIKVTPSIEEFSLLYNTLREYYLLRWSSDQILRGYKDRIGKKRIYLYDALSQGSVVKLDVWAPIHGRYIEFTNWFLIIRKDITGRTKTLSAELGDFIESLINDLINYRYSNVMKSVKRMWSLSYFLNDEETFEILKPLFSSLPALLYQIRGDIDVLIKILDKIENPPIQFMINEVLDFKRRYIEISSKSDPYFFSLIDNFKTGITINKLQTLYYYLTQIINREIEIFLEDNDIEPLEYIERIPSKQKIEEVCIFRL